MVTYYTDGKGQQEDSGSPVDTMLVTMLSVIFIAVTLLLCFRSNLLPSTEEQEQDADNGGGRRPGGWLPSHGAGGGEYRAPRPRPLPLPLERNQPSTVEVAAVRAAEPPLVCTYRRADGWPEGSCGVCLSELDDDEAVRVLPACMHYFHAACVGERLRAHATCPLCRAPLNSTGTTKC